LTESAQISLLRDGETWLIGSKNRKVLLQNPSQLSLYAGQEKYSYACEMAESFFAHFATLDAERQRLLKRFFCLTRLTANFEFESTKHQVSEGVNEKKKTKSGINELHMTINFLSCSLFFLFFCSIWFRYRKRDWF
jgi:hypothetical protein